VIDYKNFLISFIFSMVFFALFCMIALHDRHYFSSLLELFFEHPLRIAPIFACVVYCLLTKKINLLSNFAILEMFGVAVYALSLCILMLLNDPLASNEYKNTLSTVRTALYGFLWFFSEINAVLSLTSARRTSESSFAINYKNAIVSSVLTVVFFILFLLVNGFISRALR
jgi:hypothetical protein